MGYMRNAAPYNGKAPEFRSSVEIVEDAVRSRRLQEVGDTLIEALLDGAADTTRSTVATWQAGLTPDQRHHALILAGAAAEPADLLALVCRLTGVGEPPPSFGGLGDEATLWADWASVAERRAYLVVLVARLDGPDRTALRRHLRGRR
jgi:hypothetical protein